MLYPPLKSSSYLICSLSHAKLNYPDLTTNRLPNGSATVLFLSVTICQLFDRSLSTIHSLSKSSQANRVCLATNDVYKSSLRANFAAKCTRRECSSLRASGGTHRRGGTSSKNRKTYKYPHPRFIAELPNLTLGRCFTRIPEHGHTELNVREPIDFPLNRQSLFRAGKQSRNISRRAATLMVRKFDTHIRCSAPVVHVSPLRDLRPAILGHELSWDTSTGPAKRTAASLSRESCALNEARPLPSQSRLCARCCPSKASTSSDSKYRPVLSTGRSALRRR